MFLAMRSPFNPSRRAETIEETAEMVTANGGVGIPIQVDHLDAAQVQLLATRIGAEQGHLDILVNDVWGGDSLTEWGKPFWELSLAKGWALFERAVHSHLLTSRHLVPKRCNALHNAKRLIRNAVGRRSHAPITQQQPRSERYSKIRHHQGRVRGKK